MHRRAHVNHAKFRRRMLFRGACTVHRPCSHCVFVQKTQRMPAFGVLHLTIGKFGFCFRRFCAIFQDVSSKARICLSFEALYAKAWRRLASALPVSRATRSLFIVLKAILAASHARLTSRFDSEPLRPEYNRALSCEVVDGLSDVGRKSLSHRVSVQRRSG